MIGLYCRRHHGEAGLCPPCLDLLHYAHTRLDRCRFGNEKPTCFNCSVHCYNRAMGEKIREVMRYAGPRMLTRHPWLALGHLIDGWRDRKNPNSARNCGQPTLPGT